MSVISILLGNLSHTSTWRGKSYAISDFPTGGILRTWSALNLLRLCLSLTIWQDFYLPLWSSLLPSSTVLCFSLYTKHCALYGLCLADTRIPLMFCIVWHHRKQFPVDWFLYFLFFFLFNFQWQNLSLYRSRNCVTSFFVSFPGVCRWDIFVLYISERLEQCHYYQMYTHKSCESRWTMPKFIQLMIFLLCTKP